MAYTWILTLISCAAIVPLTGPVVLLFLLLCWSGALKRLHGHFRRTKSTPQDADDEAIEHGVHPVFRLKNFVPGDIEIDRDLLLPALRLGSKFLRVRRGLWMWKHLLYGQTRKMNSGHVLYIPGRRGTESQESRIPDGLEALAEHITIAFAKNGARGNTRAVKGRVKRPFRGRRSEIRIDPELYRDIWRHTGRSSMKPCSTRLSATGPYERYMQHRAHSMLAKTMVHEPAHAAFSLNRRYCKTMTPVFSPGCETDEMGYEMRNVLFGGLIGFKFAPRGGRLGLRQAMVVRRWPRPEQLEPYEKKGKPIYLADTGNGVKEEVWEIGHQWLQNVFLGDGLDLKAMSQPVLEDTAFPLPERLGHFYRDKFRVSPLAGS